MLKSLIRFGVKQCLWFINLFFTSVISFIIFMCATNVASHVMGYIDSNEVAKVNRKNLANKIKNRAKKLRNK